MSQPRSLVWRLLSRTIGAQVALLAVLAVLVSIWNAPVDGDGFFWWPHASRLIVGSLQRGADGALRLAPTPALLDYQARRPGFLFGAAEDADSDLLPGSSPRLVAVFHAIRPMRTHSGAFVVDGDGTGGGPLNGGTLLTRTAFGPVNLFAANGRFLADDFPAWAGDVGVDIGEFALPALPLGSLCMWLTVRAVLRPLRLAGRDLLGAEFRARQQRLPEDGRVPLEVLPLMQGVNKALTRLEEGLLRQRRFTANAAHEMRTPLGVLRARIDSLADGVERASLQQDGQRITNLLDQLLAIARLEQRNLDAEERFDLAACVGSVVADLFPLAVDAGRSLEFAAPPDEVPVHGSAKAVASAVGNLIDNALAAEPRGGTVGVAVAHGALVSVSDHGPGVGEQERGLVFEAFWRRDENRAGTGLGLAIVREIAALHRGKVWVEETSGGGATFRFQLPELAAAGAGTGVGVAGKPAAAPR